VIRINLAPVIDRSRRGGRRRFGLLIALCSFVFLGTLSGASWTLTQEEQRLTQSVAKALQELAAVKGMLGGGAILREDLADLTKRVRSIQTLMRRRGTTLRILDALLDAVPHGLWITTLEGRGLELRARGSALSATAVADLMSRLHASGTFDDVDIVVSRQDLGEIPDAPLLFEITCRFGG
jgi:type IV pilus assembly protein PilN